jgi:hypothetical protein
MTPQEMADYDPPVGARVEVLFKIEQESWWEGEVFRKRGSFFIINFPEEGEMVLKEVVERERLRPLHSNQQPNQQPDGVQRGGGARASASASHQPAAQPAASSSTEAGGQQQKQQSAAERRDRR